MIKLRKLLRSKYKLLSFSYLLLIVVFLIWLTGNFFAYNRAVTYNLPLLLILFTIGVTETIRGHKRLSYVIVGSFVLVVFSGLSLNKRFLREHYVIDKSLISLQNLPLKKIREPIYNEEHINQHMSLWRIIWTHYFVYPPIIDKNIN